MICEALRSCCLSSVIALYVDRIIERWKGNPWPLIAVIVTTWVFTFYYAYHIAIVIYAHDVTVDKFLTCRPGVESLAAENQYGTEAKGAGTPLDDGHFDTIVSTKFPELGNKKKTFVLQCSRKNEQKIDCAGGYLKLFNCNFNLDEGRVETPSFIIFGPDICGPGSKKVRVVINYKGNNYVITKDIRCSDDVFTHVYTLIVEPGQNYQVLVDGEKVQSGSFQKDWILLPPQLIWDPEVKKPRSDDLIKEDPDRFLRLSFAEEKVVQNEEDKEADDAQKPKAHNKEDRDNVEEVDLGEL